MLVFFDLLYPKNARDTWTLSIQSVKHSIVTPLAVCGACAAGRDKCHLLSRRLRPTHRSVPIYWKDGQCLNSQVDDSETSWAIVLTGRLRCSKLQH